MATASSISNVENLSPQIIRRVAKELNDLSNEPPEGIRVIINDDDITDIQAIIEGPAGTPYASGYFKVKLALGKDFPQGPPKAFFLTKIFHPNVAKNGEICVNTLKKDWKSDLGIKHIFSASNRIIHAKDHASIQLTLADVDPETGRMSDTFKMYAICGAIRRMGESDDCIVRLSKTDGILAKNY